MGKKASVAIVGGGSSAHVLAPLLSITGHRVHLLTSRPEKWSHHVSFQYQSINGELKSTFSGTIDSISDRPEEILPQAEVIVFCMPVSQYRRALHRIAPYINNSENLWLGAMYGQAGFNWMVEEIKRTFPLEKICYFAIGLLPWICRTIQYGKVGVTYGSKAVNVAAGFPGEKFANLKEIFLDDICERHFGKGAFVKSDNFLSLTLSVDNQIIHPARCYGLHLKDGGRWAARDRIPYFYRDFDQLSADILQELDTEYSQIRAAIVQRFPQKNFSYMLDYLALERFSYQSANTSIRESFTSSETLGAIKPPTVQNENGEWVLDTSHRFFTDDIQYGLCIAKWIAERLTLSVPVLDRILNWAQLLQNEQILDNRQHLLKGAQDGQNFSSGVPSVYGYKEIDDIVD